MTKAEWEKKVDATTEKENCWKQCYSETIGKYGLAWCILQMLEILERIWGEEIMSYRKGLKKQKGNDENINRPH